MSTWPSRHTRKYPADWAAKEVLEIHLYLRFTVPLMDLKTAVYLLAEQKFTQFWWDILTTNKLRCIIQHPAQPIWSLLPSRLSEIVISRIPIGHTRLTHSHLFSREWWTICDNCNIQGLSQNWCSFSSDGLVTLSIGILTKCTYSVVHYPFNKHPQTSVCQIDLNLSQVMAGFVKTFKCTSPKKGKKKFKN